VRVVRRFARLYAAGARVAWQCRGLGVALYALQLLASTLAGIAVARTLASAFAKLPAYGDAMNGDALALALLARDNTPVLVAALWTCLAIAALYAALSWFTTAGLIAAFVGRGKAESDSPTQAAGAGGARYGFAFARLWLWCLIPYGLIIVIAAVGIGGVDVVGAVRMSDLTVSFAVVLAPAALVAWLFNTAVDYARVDLVARDHRGSGRALLRGFATLVKRPIALVHAASYYGVWLGLSWLYLQLGGAAELSWIALLLTRQLMAAARFAAKLVLIGGQVSLTAGPTNS